MDWKSRRILVVGLGRSGVAAARLLVRHGAEVVLTEKGDSVELQEKARELQSEGIAVELGGHSPEKWGEIDLVVLSPGVSEKAFPYQWAQENQVSVVSELELASQFHSIPMVAVTGSNGKTTTTTLIERLLQAGGKRAIACGNIGIPVSEVLLEGREWDYLVVECSSFQLERIETFRPFISVLLNLTENHLDRHETFEAYLRAKSRLLENQTSEDWAFLRPEETLLLQAAEIEVPAQICFLKRADNFFAAQEVALLCGVSAEVIEASLASFENLEHRQEKVCELDELVVVNDSKATSVGAVAHALENFDSIIWIAGGRDKKSDFTSLLPQVKERVKKIILFGEAKEKLKSVFSATVPCVEVETLKEGIEIAFDEGNRGDVVLFSPGCASFDLFSSYAERGQQFKELVLAEKDRRA